ncbi:MAG TPA: hypothetical protein VGV38_20230 [Pyrinomonadaceae bacterium]|nr:hypothetical protein [Pyrinomonadaceae bacterium]
MRKAFAASLLVVLLTCSAHAGVSMADFVPPPPPPADADGTIHTGSPAAAEGIIQNGSPAAAEDDGWIGTGFASVEFVLKGLFIF